MKIKTAIAAALLAGSVSTGAEAAYLINGYSWSPGALTGNIKYTPTGLNLNVGLGRVKLTGTETPSGDLASFLTYCVDIFHTLQPALFDFASVSTLVPNPAKQTQLLTLLAHADPLIAAATPANKNQAAAAVQLAVWEIVNESTASYDYAGGTFRSTGGNSDGARALATTYLGKITSGAWAAPNGQLKLLYSATSQSQVLAAIPEPATWAMMIGGFGLIGAAARSRRARVSYVIA